MTKLNIEASCEIDNLINCIVLKTKRSYEEIESAFFDNFIYPESKKTYLTTQFGKIIDDENYEWLNSALEDIFKENKIKSIYITEAI